MKHVPQNFDWLMLVLALCCSGCGGIHLGSRTAVRKADFPTTYDEARTKLSTMKPAVKWQGKWMGVDGKEKIPGEYYALGILEGGSDWHKFAHRTTVHLIRNDDSSCRVEIHSWASNAVLPSHRMWFKEWRRWREVKRLLQDTERNRVGPP